MPGKAFLSEEPSLSHLRDCVWGGVGVCGAERGGRRGDVGFGCVQAVFRLIFELPESVGLGWLQGGSGRSEGLWEGGWGNYLARRLRRRWRGGGLGPSNWGTQKPN